MTLRWFPSFQRHVVLAVLLLFAAGAPLAAQGTALVPLDDPAYAYLDRLNDLGVVDSAVMGQRPYSYREMARLARVARLATISWKPGTGERTLVEGLLGRLEERITGAPRPSATLLAEGLVTAHGTDAVRRAITGGASGYSPQATIDPLALRRLGDPAIRGQSVALDLLQRAEPVAWLGVHARERFEVRHPDDPVSSSSTAALVEGSVRARWHNVALVVGREEVGWGSGSTGGLILAADAPALDQISIASDRPFVLPGIFRRVGPLSGTLLLSDMGPSIVRSHSEMLAYKVSARPTSTLELGATFQDHFGGEGGRTSPFWSRVIDFLPMIDIFRRHNYVDTTRVFDVDSDKALGADFRWRSDQLGGVTFAGEILIDDFDVHRLVSLLNYAASHSLSVTVPRLGSPAWSLVLGATHMGPLTYNHAQLQQGMTTRGRLLGSELGPDVKAFEVQLRWMPAPAARLSLSGQSAVYSNSTYAGGYDGNGQWVVTKTSSGTDELRERGIATMEIEPTSRLALTIRVGAGRTRNVLFLGGRRLDYVADAGLRWRP